MQRIRVGGAWQEADTRRVYQGGSWRTVKKAWVYASGSWRQYFIGASPMSISVSPSPLDFESISNTTVTGVASVSITGGLGPFTYSCTVQSFSAGVTPSVTNDTTATPTLTQTGVIASNTETAVIRFTVTDSASQTATVDLTASFTNTDFS